VKQYVVICRSEACCLADALEPVVKRHGSKKAVARVLGVSGQVISKAMSRSARVSFLPETLKLLANVGGIDVSGWGAE
jgi:hypothetical protein